MEDFPQPKDTETDESDSQTVTPSSPVVPQETSTKASRNPFKKFRLRSLWNFRALVVMLLLVIAGLLAFWLFHQRTPNSPDRTVKVTGEAIITADPDEYEFDPSYTFRNSDKNSAISAATAKQNELIARLKDLGISDKQIKANVDGYSDNYPPVNYAPGQSSGSLYTYTLSLTVTVPSRPVAQKVQDYLTTTGAEGSITPQVAFSDAKRKQLETQARQEASKDARNKADQSAKNLGFKIRGVKSVEDGTGFDNNSYCGGGSGGLCMGTSLDTGSSNSQSLSLQPGQDKYDFTVDVTFYIK